MSKQIPSASLPGHKAKQAVEPLCEARERARIAYITARVEYERLDHMCVRAWNKAYAAALKERDTA